MRIDFLDDEEKMVDFVTLGRERFMESYSYLKEEEYDATIKELWNSLGDVIIDDKECIMSKWYIFPKGTDRYEIWSWFEEHFNVSVALDLMGLPESEV